MTSLLVAGKEVKQAKEASHATRFPSLSRANYIKLNKASETGLKALIDQMQSINPEYASIIELKELSDDNFVKRDYQRPPGYTATTRCHMGRMMVPLLNDSGASCACITEEQVVIIINHTQCMLEEKLLSMDDYNYPIVQFYKYAEAATLKGAPAQGSMIVEYAVVLRVEFIPEGSSKGPVKEIYFKIFKAGTCGIVGAVLGWPQLDLPSVAGGEGLGWVNQIDGARYSTLGVTLPRADKERKMQYLQSTARYTASQGSLLIIEEQDRVSLIDGGRQLRAAALIDAPSAKMDPIGLEYLILNPGERSRNPSDMD